LARVTACLTQADSETERGKDDRRESGKRTDR
jgi:hypothetical protein